MPGEKRFGTSMFGFRKTDVNAYIERILGEFDNKLKEKDDEIASLKTQNKELRTRYDDLMKKGDQVNEDRTRIADVLIKAQDKAEQLVEDARREALEEKKKLETEIEQEREKLVDAKRDAKALKNEVINTLKRFEAQLGEIVKEDEDLG